MPSSGNLPHPGIERASAASPAMQETQVVRSLGRKDPPKKEMATYSSILAWKIPGTEEPSSLQSMGSQRDTTEHAHSCSLTRQKNDIERCCFLQNYFDQL